MNPKFKIAAYIYPQALRMPTGVSMLTLNMMRVLSRNPDVDLCLLASADELEDGGTMPPELDFAGIPVVPLPWKRSAREALWLGTNCPAIERYVPSDYWIYCSMETFIPARRCKRVVTVHHLEPRAAASALSLQAVRQWRQDFRLRKALQTADLVVAQSAFTAREVVAQHHVSGARIAVVGSGVTEEYFGVPNNQDLDSLVPDFAPYVLVTGAMDKRKGTDYLLDLGRFLARCNSRIKIVCTAGLYGSPDYIAAARALPNMVLLNFVTRQEMLAHFKKAIALIFLSRLEGFGLPLVEAMASGLPVIATGNSAIPETLAGAGVLVKPENPQQVADEIRRLQEDQNYRTELIGKGFTRARNFTWDACMRRLLAGITTISQANLEAV